MFCTAGPPYTQKASPLKYLIEPSYIYIWLKTRGIYSSFTSDRKKNGLLRLSWVFQFTERDKHSQKYYIPQLEVKIKDVKGQLASPAHPSLRERSDLVFPISIIAATCICFISLKASSTQHRSNMSLFTNTSVVLSKLCYTQGGKKGKKKHSWPEIAWGRSEHLEGSF